MFGVQSCLVVQALVKCAVSLSTVLGAPKGVQKVWTEGEILGPFPEQCLETGRIRTNGSEEVQFLNGAFCDRCALLRLDSSTPLDATLFAQNATSEPTPATSTKPSSDIETGEAGPPVQQPPPATGKSNPPTFRDDSPTLQALVGAGSETTITILKLAGESRSA